MDNEAGPIPDWIAIALKEEKVAKVFRLLCNDPLDWVALYRILEVVEEDVGGLGNIVGQGWASSRSLSRFKHTANSPSTTGDEARHGKEQTQPPAKPMTIAEARALIETVVHNWLSAKQTSIVSSPREPA
jgi:hypothetical protein